MCCLFGFYNYSGQPIGNLSHLTNCLAEEATARGTDATGIAYNHKGNLIIHKEPKSAFQVNFKHPDDIVSVTGHTRHSTQGDKKKNYNNHPFSGHCKNGRFALAHNGVLINDRELRRELHLPHTKIETDSYIAVQLIEKKKMLNIESIKFMTERAEGSFAFSILGSDNTLWLIRGESPLSLIHIPKYKLYVYASTDKILFKALVGTKLFAEIKKGAFEEFDINPGDILSISPDGTIVYDKFNYKDYSCFGNCNWWDYDITENKYENSYLDDLKSVAVYQGYSPDEVDELLRSGFTPEEIEEYIYCME
ncbi:MAG: hypothetical protein ACI4DY_06320 [Monoglobaceae bacterium]|nr:hypothetical protein [Ruminococcus sp.]